MLRVDNLKLTPEESEALLPQKAAAALHVKPDDITDWQILRKSVDARETPVLVYSIAVTVKNEKRCRGKGISPYAPIIYRLPGAVKTSVLPPVVVGMGPGGLFAALVLARCGLRPIVLERGEPVERRRRTVERFWQDGELNTESNVQFGEGGAGAFSDGKLNTGTKDVRHRFILEQMVRCGAPESILCDAKPHAGTDRLHVMLQNLRRELLDLGADLRFGHKLTDITVKDGTLTSLTITADGKSYALPCRQCILALGHSSRDTVEMLYDRGVFMEQKAFAMGVRIEHSQHDLDAQQYREFAGHPALPVSTYKLACHLPNGRSAFSFCVCPGGQVVAAASEESRLVTNGMSAYARDGENINGALLVNITPEDFGSTHPLAGIELQRRLEEAAFRQGGSSYRAPCQRVEDFLLKRPSTGHGAIVPSYRPGVVWGDLHDCLPDFIAETLELALPVLDRKLPGYAAPDALLTAVESRSSAPVRIPRDESYQCNIRGIYPCGEGAGYAGGILSAAADGMRCAEQIIGGLET